MKGLLAHPFLVIFRFSWLATELALATFSYLFGFLPGKASDPRPVRKALWLQRSCRRVLRILNLDLRTSGDLPASGLLVCNHLSYVDILVLSSLIPTRFIAKHEVKYWPVFGWLATFGGTLFINRNRRIEAARQKHQIENALADGVVLVLFPEGTSSDGRTVLPFKSSLLESATHGRHDVAIGRLSYSMDDGSVEDEVCYWADMTLFPHLINLLSKRGLRAGVSFAAVENPARDRKQLARQLHERILRLGTLAGSRHHFKAPAEQWYFWRSTKPTE